MSYMRSPYPLSRFCSISEYYVYHDGDGVRDNGAKYHHLPSLVELIGDMIEDHTCDENFAAKIVATLSDKLGISDKLRDDGHSISYEDWDAEEKAFSEFLKSIDKHKKITFLSRCIAAISNNPSCEGVLVKELVYSHKIE